MYVTKENNRKIKNPKFCICTRRRVKHKYLIELLMFCHKDRDSKGDHVIIIHWPSKSRGQRQEDMCQGSFAALCKKTKQAFQLQMLLQCPLPY